MNSDDSSELVVKEGFLCPICLQDLGDIVQLQVHVTGAHNSSSPADSADLALHQLKDLFGRAKQRILKFESALTVFAPPIQTKFDDPDQQRSTSPVPVNAVTRYSEYFRESSPTLGVTTSHTAYFKRIRDARVDQCAVETNKIIIRLDKLITEAPSDPSKRKGIQQETFEKDTVTWVSDSDVQYCRDCGGKFSITKRRHHCRLCGRIVCGTCSHFLTFSYAKKLTNPAFAAGYKTALDSGDTTGGDNLNVAGADRRASGSSGGSPKVQFKAAGEKLLSALATKLKRDGSEVSLSSLFNQEGEDQLRICKDCMRLLDNRDQQIEQRTQPPIITQMYERLRDSMEEAERLFPSYCKMAESLSIGESVYDLETAKDVRLRLLKIQEQIDFLSRRIATLGLTEEDSAGSAEGETGPTPITCLPVRQRMLQKSVRQFAAAFLQDIAYHTPALPTPNEYTKLQADYKKELEKRIAKERATAAAAAMATAQGQKVPELGATPKHRSSPDSFSHYERKLLTAGGGDTDAGWTPDTSTVTATLFRFNPFDDAETIDPLREQILLTKGYIKQAAVAGRLEDVKLLEKSLRELEEELKLQSSVITPRGQL